MSPEEFQARVLYTQIDGIPVPVRISIKWEEDGTAVVRMSAGVGEGESLRRVGIAGSFAPNARGRLNPDELQNNMEQMALAVARGVERWLRWFRDGYPPVYFGNIDPPAELYPEPNIRVRIGAWE